MIQPGRVIDGKYVVDAVLGEGGMGVVLRATHSFTRATVALKMLKPELASNPLVAERFLKESQLPSSIGHPGIVRVFDAGKTPQGELYLVMEMLTGRPLRDAIGPMFPRSETMRVGLELLDALGAAHARGIVHRDLKPENVFLQEPTSSVKLLDFGIAKGGGVVDMRTSTGMMLGTLAYMSPEQLTDASAVDARADLWAVGVMLYEMIAARLPFPTHSMEAMFAALMSKEAEPIARYAPDLAPPVLEFFARALARDRAHRYGSAPEMAAALRMLPLGSAVVRAPIVAAAPPPMVSANAQTAASVYGTPATGGNVATAHPASVPGYPAAFAVQSHGTTPPPPPTPPPYGAPPLHAMPPPAVSTQAVRKGSKAPLVIAILVGLAGIVLLAVLVNKRRHVVAPPPVTPDAAIDWFPPSTDDGTDGSGHDDLDTDGDDTDSAGLHPPALPDHLPVPDAWPKDVPEESVTESVTACESRCASMLACGFSSAECEDACKEPQWDMCLQVAAQTKTGVCNLLAVCAFTDHDDSPAGTLDCGQSLDCNLRCLKRGGTPAQLQQCSHDCVVAMSPEAAEFLLPFTMCALYTCRSGPDCILSTCRSRAQTCVNHKSTGNP